MLYMVVFAVLRDFGRFWPSLQAFGNIVCYMFF